MDVVPIGSSRGCTFGCWLSWLTCLICCIALPAYGDYIETDCVGSGTATTHFVYLHGWDNPGVGAHERLNRSELKRLAEQHNYRIAMPRGRGRCSKSKSEQCWNITSQTAILDSWKIIQDAASQCFPKVLDWGVLGFSNGGYMVASIYNLCLEPRPSWLVSYGAGENGAAPVINNPDCTPFAHFVGTNDPTLQRSRDYAKKLMLHRSKAVWKEIPGGHYIDFANLPEVIRKLRGLSLPIPASTTNNQNSPITPTQ